MERGSHTFVKNEPRDFTLLFFSGEFENDELFDGVFDGCNLEFNKFLLHGRAETVPFSVYKIDKNGRISHIGNTSNNMVVFDSDLRYK
ncbi:hypothetical protein ECANGB1_1714 [Enterospora canceri]|uniref:Uncharacterized protein n=1 Tax=Enterospora canceri TaxID=1081671 RepID=A0A1Y1S9D0_9MICR|nr:hypothetical protein ECANGB1_1714 [Enterospora canceri]